jgi:hypothetical protein
LTKIAENIYHNVDPLQDQTLRNEELFGPVTNDTLVIVIQVHNRLQYLRHLIVSLSQVS